MSYTPSCIPLQWRTVGDGFNGYSVARDDIEKKKNFLEGSYKHDASLRGNEGATLWYLLI